MNQIIIEIITVGIFVIATSVYSTAVGVGPYLYLYLSMQLAIMIERCFVVEAYSWGKSKVLPPELETLVCAHGCSQFTDYQER